LVTIQLMKFSLLSVGGAMSYANFVGGRDPVPGPTSADPPDAGDVAGACDSAAGAAVADSGAFAGSGAAFAGSEAGRFEALCSGGAVVVPRFPQA
jgi:hypothetical protein